MPSQMHTNVHHPHRAEESAHRSEKSAHRSEQPSHRPKAEAEKGKNSHETSSSSSQQRQQRQHHAAETPDEALDNAKAILPDEYTTWLEYTRKVEKLYRDYGVGAFNEKERREHLVGEASLLEDCVNELKIWLKDTSNKDTADNKIMRAAYRYMKKALDEIMSEVGEIRSYHPPKTAPPESVKGLHPNTIAIIEHLDQQAQDRYMAKLKPGVANVYGVEVLDPHTEARLHAALRLADKLASKH